MTDRIKEEEEEVCVVYEVGSFGDLDITDPTKKKVKKSLAETVREYEEGLLK